MSVAGSAYFPMDCHLSPRRLMSALTSAIERDGGRFLWRTGISEWRTSGTRIGSVATSLGGIEGDAFVVAAGSYSQEVVRPLRIRLPIQAGKGYSFDLPVSGPRSSVQTCAILSEARVA